MFKRVAKYVSNCESESAFYQSTFYKRLSNLKFLPNSPTLMNAGCKKGQLSAGFVLPPEDRLESIFTTLKNIVPTHQSGGGTEFNFSKFKTKGRWGSLYQRNVLWPNSSLFRKCKLWYEDVEHKVISTGSIQHIRSLPKSLKINL